MPCPVPVCPFWLYAPLLSHPASHTLTRLDRSSLSAACRDKHMKVRKPAEPSQAEATSAAGPQPSSQGVRVGMRCAPPLRTQKTMYPTARAGCAHVRTSKWAKHPYHYAQADRTAALLSASVLRALAVIAPTSSCLRTLVGHSQACCQRVIRLTDLSTVPCTRMPYVPLWIILPCPEA